MIGAILRVMVVVGLIWSSGASALVYFGTATITRLLATDTAYGACMALVSAIPPGVSCSSPSGAVGWVTFACDGTYGTKSLNIARFSQAQLALVTGNEVVIYADDSKKINGHCYSPRLDVLNTTP